MSEMTPERIARALSSAVVFADELPEDEPEGQELRRSAPRQ